MLVAAVADKYVAFTKVHEDSTFRHCRSSWSTAVIAV